MRGILPMPVAICHPTTTVMGDVSVQSHRHLRFGGEVISPSDCRVAHHLQLAQVGDGL